MTLASGYSPSTRGTEVDMMHSYKFLLVSFLTILLTAVVVSSPLALAQSDFTVLRASFDMVITEVAGENYVMIDNYDPYGYLENRPINWTYRFGKVPWRDMVYRDMIYQELRNMLEECLPEVEASLELKYWACYAGIDEDPPAIYVGLYKPTEKQMSTIVQILGESARAKGFVIKFYEAYGYIGLRQKLEEAEKKLITTIENGAIVNSQYRFSWSGLDQIPEIEEGTINLPICSLSSYNSAGWLRVGIEYGEITDHVDGNFVADIAKAVRAVVGYEVPILFNFLKEPQIVQPLPLPPEEQPSPAETSPNIAYIILLTTIPVVAIIASTLKRKRKIQ